MSGRVSAVALLAKRFLLSKSSEGFISFIAWVSVVGVALGVLALTVVTSVFNGFEGELTRVITGMNGDVVLYSRAEPVRNADAVESKIRRVLPETREITRSFVVEMMVAGPAAVAGAVLEGIDPLTVGGVTAIPKRIISGRMPVSDNEVMLGASLAERIGARDGSEIRLILPLTGADAGEKAGEKEPEIGTPRAVQAQVVGVVKMGMYEYDSKFLFGTLSGVQRFLEQPDGVTSFKLRLPDRVDTRFAASKLSDSFGYPFRAKDWAQLNKNLFYAVRLEKVVIAIVLTAIVIVAAFNVVSTLMMMIHDKTREISILKAMGFRPGQSFRLFCVIGLGMGLIGTGAGIGLGMAINWILGKTRLIDLPPDIYYVSTFPVVVRWSEIGMIAAIAIVIAFLATVYPGWKAARRSPLDGIRYE